MGNTYTYLEDVITVDAGLSHSVLYKEDGSVFAVGDNSCGQTGTGSFAQNREIRPVQVGGTAHDAIKPKWAQIWYNRQENTTYTYGTGTNRAVPDYFTLHVNDSLVLDVNQMARYFSEGFNLYADSEAADIRGDVRFTIEDTTIAAQTQRGTNLYGFYNPIENGSHKPGSTIITIGYYVNNILVASSQIRITFVDTKVDLTEPMVATGTTHTVALGQDGSVWVWGQNDKGQLGVGNTAIYDTNYEYPFNVLKADIDGKVEIGGQKVTVTKVHAGNGFTLLQVIDANNRSVVYVAGTAAGTAYGNEFTLMNVTDAEGTTITQVSAYGDHFIMVLGGNTGMFMVEIGRASCRERV